MYRIGDFKLVNLPKLATIDLRDSKKLIECPNVSGSPNLKHVTLNRCESLPEVDSSIFHLQKLETLCVAGCTLLKSLFSNTCSPALHVLNAMNCFNLKEFSVPFASVDGLHLYLSKWNGNELPSSILHTQNIKKFAFPISDCLVDLPENFCDNIWLGSQRNPEQDPFITLDKLLSSPAFMSVKVLTFCKIPILSEFPDSISLLSSLKYLNLIHMAIKSLPETIKYLPRLECVRVYDCRLLQSIPALYWFITNEESIPCFLFLINYNKLDPHSYQTVLKEAMDGFELEARHSSENEDAHNYIILNFLPAMPGTENWFHYSSTQVSDTLELPSNLLGFAYYLVLSPGIMDFGVGFGCKCYLDNSSGERICITSFTEGNSIESTWNYTSFRMKSNHLVLWYDPQICKQIMDTVQQTKAITDANSTIYNSKLTFTFFMNETLYDEVEIKECGFRWIYQQETVSSTISESHVEEETMSSSDFQSNEQEEIVSPTNFESDDLEETFPPRNKLKLDIVGTPPSNLQLDERHDLRYSLEELMHIGFRVDHMNTLFGSTEEEESNS
ncbi:disease resistance protein (TIR-NBS-LRR class) family protein, putative [Medicago truncatula]|uniref:Disease resistance protein (TIR-NBS-LRR class) family protein, putative n=1 Tax=Medicago truncatula TaxID=3880 RepID=A0A072TLM9_MEDTR|nr:disease resistance protein (TIR-NBS-LRR class) family protein, putative [Medicago truncatula]